MKPPTHQRTSTQIVTMFVKASGARRNYWLSKELRADWRRRPAPALSQFDMVRAVPEV